ncbi:MAG: hypothetical protein LBH05_00955 [Deferribacteraceae bacterium]|jgi:hypothetical protein|nr:hypothetical protein [Deferribacteraceae bacterium]
MRKIFLFAAALIFFSVNAFAQNTDNPGYFDSPGFLAFGGGMSYPFGNTHRDPDVRPFITGMWNVIRSEYGHIGLSVTGFYTIPYRNYNNDQFSYRILTQQYVGDLSLNYVTGSKTINFWLGAGVNLNYAESRTQNMKNNINHMNFDKNFYQTVYGYQYHVGLEYILTQSGVWGLYVLIRGQHTSRAKFDIEFPDGTLNTNTMDLSNKSYIFGMTYHF